MRRATPSRRAVLAGAAATFGATLLPARAAEPSAALVAAARKEGKVHFLSAGDLLLVTRIAKAFEAAYPEIKVQAERLGSERIFSRLDQEYASGIRNVDVIDSADAAHFLVWKKQNWLAPHVPPDVAQHWPDSERDPDGTFATYRASMAIMGHNTKLLAAEEAPKRYLDLVEPKWARKLVKAHPSYSGTVATATFIFVREFGWSFLEALAKQRVMQVQSVTEPPKKLAAGERAVMVEGSDYVLFDLEEKGNPVAPIYPAEGTPLIPINAAVMKDAPNPNAARLFHQFLYRAETQQMLVDVGNTRSFHPAIREKKGRRPFKEIKKLRADPAELLVALEEIRRRYTQIFGA